MPTRTSTVWRTFRMSWSSISSSTGLKMRDGSSGDPVRSAGFQGVMGTRSDR